MTYTTLTMGVVRQSLVTAKEGGSRPSAKRGVRRRAPRSWSLRGQHDVVAPDIVLAGDGGEVSGLRHSPCQAPPACEHDLGPTQLGADSAGRRVLRTRRTRGRGVFERV